MDKDQWLISWTKYDKSRKDPRAGKKCFKTTTFKELDPTDNKDLCRAQLFVTEDRVINNNLEEKWKDWVNVTYVDIDAKFYWKENGEGDIIPERYNKDNPAVVYSLVYNWMVNNYRDNICDAEMSRSKFGFHFYFKWDCERNEYNRTFFSRVSNEIIKKAFIETGYKHIIEYPKVFDDCTNSPVQFVYPTKINHYHNYYCNGKLGIYNDLNVNINDIISKKEKSKTINQIEKVIGVNLKSNAIYEFVLKNKRKVDKVDYIEHHTRWRLFESLSRIFEDPDELRLEWNECCKKIPYKHTLQFYMDEPYKNNEGYTWNNNLKGDEYCDLDLLNTFGYEVEIVKIANKNNDMFDFLLGNTKI